MLFILRTELQTYQHLKAKVHSFSNLLQLHTFVNKRGRKLAIPLEDILTIAVFKQESQIETKKSVYELLELQDVCSYKTLVVNMNRWYFLALNMFALIMRWNRFFSHCIKHTDTTDIPVCLNKNAKYHKTMKGLASWDHNGKGYYYGLKLHLTSDLHKNILSVRFTSGSTDPRTVFIKLNQDMMGLFIADAGYVSESLQTAFHKEGARRVMIASRKNMKRLATFLDIALYRTRMMIEFNFRNLKMFYGLLTSLPRSVDGYLANYTYSLLAYVLS